MTSRTPTTDDDEAHRKTVSAVAALLNPDSIAIVGASDKSRWSEAAYLNLTRGGYKGKIHLVNPRGTTAHGLSVAKTSVDVGERVDLGLVMAPLAAVADAVADLGRAGARSAVILTAGFSETGPAGVKLQEHVRDVAAASGVRVLGPNCLGFINYVDSVNAWTAPINPPSKRTGVAVVSQSGATASFLSLLAYQQDVGLSHVVSVGNEADLDCASFIEYLIEDSNVRSIALFAETFRNAAHFKRTAERAITVGKPIVMLKVGASEVTAKSAMAHTGALVGDDRVVDGICQQFGIIRVRSMDELLATADVVGRTGLLRPGGICVVTNSGGVGEIAADSAHLHGLAVPAVTEATAQELSGTIPAIATAHNPMDLTGTVTPEQTEGVMLAMGTQEDYAAILCPYFEIPTVPEHVSERLTQLHMHLTRGMAAAPIPGLLVSYTPTTVNDMARKTIAEIGANYLACGLDRAISGLAGAAWWSQRHREYLARPKSSAASGASNTHTTPTKERPKSEHEALEFLSRLGVPVVPAKLARDAESAVHAARAMGGPVVIKVASPDIAHKSDIGGVVLNVSGDEAVQAAVEQVLGAAKTSSPQAHVEGVLVAPMRGRGVELFVGYTRDPQWGPILAVGLGGVWVEVLQDVALRPLPVDADEVKRMLMGLRGAKLLQGQRGVPAVDLDAVAAAIERIGIAIESLGPDLVELDVNPLWVCGNHVEALDALFVWKEM